MKFARRRFLHLAAGAAALPALLRLARADDYPTAPVHLIVAVPPGGTFDIVGRLIAQGLSERLKQSFVVENRAGANTNIGTAYVAHAAPDGYKLLLCGSPSAINATLYNDLDFVFARDIAPVGAVERAPLIVAVNPALGPKTIDEFIGYAKASPGKVNMGTGGVGSTGDVAGALFNMMTGLNITRVPYRGEAPAVVDLLGGQVQVVFVTAGSAFNFVRAGTLRALGVTSTTRLTVLPDVPAVAESVPNYEAVSWAGIGAPHGTPADIVDRLNGALAGVLADTKIKSQLADFGAAPMPVSPADFGKFIAAEIDKWGKVVKAANMKPE